jgi:hypothetical protein
MNEARKNESTQEFLTNLRNHGVPDQKRSSIASVVKSPAAEFPRDSMKPDTEFLFDESLPRIPSADVKEIQQLSRFPPVIVIPRSAAQNSVVQEDSSCAAGTTQRR